MKEKIKNIFENILVSMIVIGIVLFFYLNIDQCVPLFNTWFIVGIAFVIVLVLTILIYFYFNLGKIKFREEIY